MEMQETKSVNESKEILGKILTKAFEVPEDTSFSDLLKKCDGITYSREILLERANELVIKLLSSDANNDVKTNH